LGKSVTERIFEEETFKEHHERALPATKNYVLKTT
jgi:hypothetical protein